MYDFNLDYQNNPNYNRFAVWASFTTDDQRTAYLAWVAQQSANATNNPASS